MLPEAGTGSHTLRVCQRGCFGRLGLLTHGGGLWGAGALQHLGPGGACCSPGECSLWHFVYHTTGVHCVPNMSQAQSWAGHTEMTGTPGQEAGSLVRMGLR